HSFHTMKALMEHGLTDDEIRLVADGAPFASKFTKRGDVDAEIDRVRAKWDGEVKQPRARAERVTADDIRAWPILTSKAMHGIAGDIVKLATKDSEADPVAVLATTLTFAGAQFGRAQFVRAGDVKHHSCHFTGIVGRSSRARKGTSKAPVARIFGE